MGSEMCIRDRFSTADFAALDDLVAKLNSDNGSGIRGSISEVEAISNKLTVSYGTMASRVAAIESQRTIIEDTELRIDELLLREDDLDYAAAVTELTQESVALQALQASFAKLSQLTLINFLR